MIDKESPTKNQSTRGCGPSLGYTTGPSEHRDVVVDRFRAGAVVRDIAIVRNRVSTDHESSCTGVEGNVGNAESSVVVGSQARGAGECDAVVISERRAAPVGGSTPVA